MAYLVPDNLRSAPSVPKPVRRVATALAVGLDDAATAWWEPPFDVDGVRPDLVVLDPSLGVVVLAVFDQQEGQDVLGAVRGQLRVAADGDEVAVANPLERANQFGLALQGAFASTPGLERVGVAGVAAFPYLGRAAAEQLGLDAVVALDQCLFQEDVKEATLGDGAPTLARVFARALEGGLDEPLDEAQEARLRGLVHPEVVISTVPEQLPLFNAQRAGSVEQFRAMDRRQENVAKRLGSGHRVIRGVAGSGKTLILVARARLLARLYPGERFLVTCYTRSLAGSLREQLAEHPNVDVVHVDLLMNRAVRAAGLQNPGYNGPVALSEVAVQALEERPPDRYRAVLVDEAQDLDTDTLRFCVALAEPGPDGTGDVLVVADSAQNIFGRRFNWSTAGIKASGRTTILRRNYRNTREVLRFAHDFLAADPAVELDATPEAEDSTTVVPADDAERSGPEPEVFLVAGADEEVAKVVDLVAAHHRPDLPPRSVAILMVDQRSGSRAAQVVAGLAERGVPAFWQSDPDEPANKDRAGSTDEPVVVSTVHSAKGLEYPVVVMCGLGASGDLKLRKTIYVGLTRALDELAVVTTTDGVFAADLLAASTTAQ